MGRQCEKCGLECYADGTAYYWCNKCRLELCTDYGVCYTARIAPRFLQQVKNLQEENKELELNNEEMERKHRLVQRENEELKEKLTFT